MQQIWRIIWLCCGLISLPLAAQPRVATLDWTVAETLLGLGITPIAVGDKQSYQTWVTEPTLPRHVIDLGTRLQPNKELLATLSIEIFPNSDMYQPAVETNRVYLSKLQQAPHINFYQAGDFWQNQLQATRQLATTVSEPAAAEKLIAETEQVFRASKEQLQPYTTRSLLVVQFIDGRHLRVYGKQSLPGVVIEKLGFTNAWQQEVNLWGTAQISLNQLAQFDHARLIVIKPYPNNIPDELANNTLWHSLHLAKDPIVLPSIWTFGALPSMQRLARALVNGFTSGGEIW
ncbi:ABC transporter substrate-binding protein [Gallibacterium salpingitidis]|uniref:Fe/B12 periplasmic-binding domain-containing protein n=1 Tax=Gallibacterium salpingitidis TaxID=505341 RepID=A0A1A7NR63_9PAST|nr:ABC transporter substrate-binding protein [Gallibacterium salpingitidis]OBW92100.1 hypothetical protein QS62_09435 [Gallibacterium salpingitidis]